MTITKVYRVPAVSTVLSVLHLQLMSCSQQPHNVMIPILQIRS